MNIEEKFLPKNGKLIKKNKVATAQLLDEELDVIDCVFNNDDCVEINTDELAYIVLSKANLMRLIELIDEAEEYYDKVLK